MKNYAFIFCLFLIQTGWTNLQAQNTMSEDLPYRNIPEYPKKYNACTVAARTIDGLGFRYYWATDSLRKEDLDYTPSKGARTSLQTIQHIYQLSVMVLTSVKGLPYEGADASNMEFQEVRKKTLMNFKEASDILKASKPKQIEKYQIVFKSERGESSFPFWNQLNGPIADAIWHTGQIVSFRRASGNPLNSNISVFRGEVRE